MKVFSLFFFLIYFNSLSVGQNIGATEIEDSAVKPWLTKVHTEYAGVYHFGESESESNLKIFFSGPLIVGQIKSGYWEEGTGIWKWKYVNLSNIEIQKNGQFKSDQYNGQFVTYSSHKLIHKGLKISNPWNTWLPNGEYEVGIRLKKDPFDYLGRYPQASFKLLTLSEIETFSKENLQIMRNEIFARYGYIFTKGGEMDKYFKTQNWYHSQHKNVNSFLTELELLNIELIKIAELKKQ